MNYNVKEETYKEKWERKVGSKMNERRYNRYGEEIRVVITTVETIRRDLVASSLGNLSIEYDKINFLNSLLNQLLTELETKGIEK